MRAANLGKVVFAAVMIGLGLIGLISRDFAPIWQPSPKGVPEREVLAYLCGALSLAGGAGLLWRPVAAPAARGLLIYLVAWLLIFRVTAIVQAPVSQESWSGFGETAVIVAGAWALHVRLADDWDRRRLAFSTGNTGLRIARSLYGVALIPFGIAHFIYARQTAAMVPGWLPAHTAWAYATGAAYLAAGAAILADLFARAAAMLSAVQIGLFTLLVWAPRIAAGSAGAETWSETIISVTLTAGAWVIADSYGETASRVAGTA
jgi:uncharacterized membrane protein